MEGRLGSRSQRRRAEIAAGASALVVGLAAVAAVASLRPADEVGTGSRTDAVEHRLDDDPPVRSATSETDQTAPPEAATTGDGPDATAGAEDAERPADGGAPRRAPELRGSARCDDPPGDVLATGDDAGFAAARHRGLDLTRVTLEATGSELAVRFDLAGEPTTAIGEGDDTAHWEVVLGATVPPGAYRIAATYADGRTGYSVTDLVEGTTTTVGGHAGPDSLSLTVPTEALPRLTVPFAWQATAHLEGDDVSDRCPGIGELRAGTLTFPGDGGDG